MDANGDLYEVEAHPGEGRGRFETHLPTTAQRVNATAAEDAMRAMTTAERAQMRKLIDDGLIELVLDERPVVYTGRAARRAAERRANRG